MFRPIKKQDKWLYLDLTKQFYQSDAVLHDIPEQYRINAFDEMMRSSVYLEGYLFEWNGHTAGYAIINKTYSQELGGMVYGLEELFLLPQFRSKGLGREFFQCLEHDSHARRIRLEVSPDNDRAISFYQRLGFKPLSYTQMGKDILSS